MKNFKKMILVPYNESKYNVDNISNENNLNEETAIHNILHMNIPDDQKVKLYQNAIAKFKLKYDEKKFTKPEIHAINNLSEQIKQNYKKIKLEHDEQINNIKDEHENTKKEIDEFKNVDHESKKENNVKFKENETNNFSMDNAYNSFPYNHEINLKSGKKLQKKIRKLKEKLYDINTPKTSTGRSKRTRPRVNYNNHEYSYLKDLDDYIKIDKIDDLITNSYISP